MKRIISLLLSALLIITFVFNVCATGVSGEQNMNQSSVDISTENTDSLAKTFLSLLDIQKNDIVALCLLAVLAVIYFIVKKRKEAQIKNELDSLEFEDFETKPKINITEKDFSKDNKRGES